MMHTRLPFAIGVALLAMTLNAARADHPAVVAKATPDPAPVERPYIPDTISPQARAVLLDMLSGPHETVFSAQPKTPAEWAATKAATANFVTNLTKPLVDSLGPTVSEVRLGAVPALKVEPKGGSRGSSVLVFVHGGGFTLLSARSSIVGAALMAAKTGMTVYSIDYTTAPEGQWQTVTDQVIAAYRALLKGGHLPKQIGMYGDSAGGSIVAGSVLKMRDSGIPMPAALVLQSPWSDVTETGESYHTLRRVDPMLSMDQLKGSADAYAAPADQKNPYVSPVYGDYTKGFPPTLIQGGTREIFLSNFVRQYRAIDRAGGRAVLDLYEGMPHVFQTLLAGSPESDAAYAKAIAFWKAELAK